jgi:hypothetical protein
MNYLKAIVSLFLIACMLYFCAACTNNTYSIDTATAVCDNAYVIEMNSMSDKEILSFIHSADEYCQGRKK